MALGQIPPWLDVHPSDFVKAAQMGAETGLSVARLRQASEEAAANRAQSASEFAAKLAQAQEEMGFKRWEEQQKLQLEADRLQQQAALTGATLSARTAYNLANLSLREQNAKSMKEYRESQSDRLATLADLQQRAEKRRVQEEDRRQKTADLANDTWLIKEHIRSLYDQLKLETDPPRQKEIRDQIAEQAQKLADLTGNPLDSDYLNDKSTAAPVPPVGPQPTGFSLLHPSTWFGRGGNAAPAATATATDVPPPPQAPPTPVAAPAGVKRQGKWKIKLIEPAPAGGTNTADQVAADVPPPKGAGTYSTAAGFDAETYDPYDPSTQDEEPTDEEER